MVTIVYSCCVCGTDIKSSHICTEGSHCLPVISPISAPSSNPAPSSTWSSKAAPYTVYNMHTNQPHPQCSHTHQSEALIFSSIDHLQNDLLKSLVTCNINWSHPLYDCIIPGRWWEGLILPSWALRINLSYCKPCLSFLISSCSQQAQYDILVIC